MVIRMFGMEELRLSSDSSNNNHFGRMLRRPLGRLDISPSKDGCQDAPRRVSTFIHHFLSKELCQKKSRQPVRHLQKKSRQPDSYLQKKIPATAGILFISVKFIS